MNQARSHDGSSCDQSQPPHVRKGKRRQPAIRWVQVEALPGPLSVGQKVPDGDSDDSGSARSPRGKEVGGLGCQG